MLFLEQSESHGTLSGEVTEGKEKENVSPASVGEKTTEKGEFLSFALMCTNVHVFIHHWST